MSISSFPLDPSLHDVPPPPPRPSISRSPKKRKSRSSISLPTPSPGGRVTRRSTALTHVHESGEPSRGEEENLIKYSWGRGDKRPRRQSPTKPGDHRKTDATRFTAPNFDQKHFLGSGNLAGPSNGSIGDFTSYTTTPRLEAPKYHAQPYPLGRNPFRYPCLAPHHPPPPPGDPFAPTFHPFDPSAPDESPLQPNQDPRPPDTFHMPDPSDAAAYESLSALLAASHSDPNEQGYPRSPGERSDNQGGALTPNMVGRYSMGMRLDCEACRTGLPGHWGHWMKGNVRWGVEKPVDPKWTDMIAPT